jgi:hypothetical protein
VALVGVVVGALLVGVVNYFSLKSADQRRWKREDSVRARDRRETLEDAQRQVETDSLSRDEEIRRGAYADFMAACGKINKGVRGKEMLDELQRSYMYLELTSRSDKVRDVATRFMSFFGLVMTEPEGTANEIEGYGETMEEFVTAARKDLGL